MKSFAIVAVSAALLGLAGCATAPAPDLRGGLLAACANPADASPWKLTATWNDGEIVVMDIRFHEDGLMVYEVDGTSYENARWVLDGGALKIDTNDHFADYSGVFDGAVGSGKMTNVEDFFGDWIFAKSCTA